MADRSEYFKKYYENRKSLFRKSKTDAKFNKIVKDLKTNEDRAEAFRKQLAQMKSC